MALPVEPYVEPNPQEPRAKTPPPYHESRRWAEPARKRRKPAKLTRRKQVDLIPRWEQARAELGRRPQLRASPFDHGPSTDPQPSPAARGRVNPRGSVCDETTMHRNRRFFPNAGCGKEYDPTESCTLGAKTKAMARPIRARPKTETEEASPPRRPAPYPSSDDDDTGKIFMAQRRHDAPECSVWQYLEEKKPQQSAPQSWCRTPSFSSSLPIGAAVAETTDDATVLESDPMDVVQEGELEAKVTCQVCSICIGQYASDADILWSLRQRSEQIVIVTWVPPESFDREPRMGDTSKQREQVIDDFIKGTSIWSGEMIAKARGAILYRDKRVDRLEILHTRIEGKYCVVVFKAYIADSSHHPPPQLWGAHFST